MLLVDDDRDMVRGLDIRLRAGGFDTAQAFDGREGLDWAMSAAPDAIVVDVRMPGMDGLSMLTRLRACRQTQNIPTIVISGKHADETRSDAERLGAFCFFEKPCPSGELLHALKRAVGPVHHAP